MSIFLWFNLQLAGRQCLRNLALFARKFIISVGYLSTLGLACSGAKAKAQEGAPAAAGRSEVESAPAEHKQADDTEAEPISPDTVRRFPHLAPFVGNILIGTASLQVVLAGVPTVAPAGPWQPAVLAFFSAPQGLWLRQEALGGIDLQNTAPGGANLHQIAVDIGRDPDGAVAYVSFIYAAAAAPGPKQLVTWRLDGSLGRLAVYFDRFLGQGSFATESKGPPLAPFWRLRLGGEANLLSGPSATLTGLRGTSYLLRYRGTDTVGILGYRPFSLKDEVLIPEPGAKGSQPPPVEGMEFLLTPAATATLLARGETLKSCLYGVDRPRADLRDEAKVEWTQSCDTVLTLASLHLRLAADDEGPSVSQPVFIFNEAGKIIQYVAVPAGMGLSLALPPGNSYQLADTAAGRLIEDVPAFGLGAGESKDLALPARRSGLLRVNATGTPTGATLLALEPLLGNDRDAGLLGEPLPLARLSRHVWLLNNPQFSTKLLAGSYLLSMADGRAGVYCRQRVVVAGGYQSEVDCAASKSASPLSHEVVFADLALPLAHAGSGVLAASAAQHWTAEVRTAAAQALALDLVSDAPAAGPVVPDVHTTDSHTVPVITASSGSTDVVLRYWPATPPFHQRWLQALGSNPPDPMGRLARFVQDEAAPGWTELGCPGPTTSLSEYEQLVHRLRPSAVRLFGCNLAGSASGWLELWAKLALQERQFPLLLTSASTLEAAESGPMLPRLAFEKAAGAGEPNATPWSILARRAYSLSAGATVFLRQLRPLTAGAPVQRGGKAHGSDSELTISLTVLAGAHAKDITVFTENGRLKKVVLPSDFGSKGLVTVTPLNLGSGKWLRVEIRGTSGALVAGRGAERTDALLAASNFASIASLAAGTKAEETH